MSIIKILPLCSQTRKDISFFISVHKAVVNQVIDQVYAQSVSAGRIQRCGFRLIGNYDRILYFARAAGCRAGFTSRSCGRFTGSCGCFASRRGCGCILSATAAGRQKHRHTKGCNQSFLHTYILSFSYYRCSAIYPGTSAFRRLSTLFKDGIPSANFFLISTSRAAAASAFTNISSYPSG